MGDFGLGFAVQEPGQIMFSSRGFTGRTPLEGKKSYPDECSGSTSCPNHRCGPRQRLFLPKSTPSHPPAAKARFVASHLIVQKLRKELLSCKSHDMKQEPSLLQTQIKHPNSSTENSNTNQIPGPFQTNIRPAKTCRLSYII